MSSLRTVGTTGFPKGLMNAVVRQHWIEAILSGRFKQGGGGWLRTRMPNGDICYCVTGVLCQLYLEDTEYDDGEELAWEERPLQSTEDEGTKFALNNLVGMVPSPVLEWAGITSHLIHEDGHDVLESLISRNDEGMTFKDLAEIIKEKM